MNKITAREGGLGAKKSLFFFNIERGASRFLREERRLPLASTSNVLQKNTTTQWQYECSDMDERKNILIVKCECGGLTSEMVERSALCGRLCSSRNPNRKPLKSLVINTFKFQF